MPSRDAYEKNFLPHQVPKALVELLEFQSSANGFFSEGFELADDDKGAIKNWSSDSAFFDRLCPIGMANFSRSMYALWLENEGDLATAPVVVFGDEGGVHVVAEDIVSLLRILTFDTEPMNDDEKVFYYRDEDDYEPSDRAADYVAWLAKHVEQKPVSGADEVEELVKAAQKRFAKPFATWMKRYHGG